MIVSWAASSGIADWARPPTPTRCSVCPSKAFRSSVTSPPSVATTSPPPSTTSRKRLCARRLASSQSAWGRGLSSSLSVARTARSLSAPEAGPASAPARGESPSSAPSS